MWNRLGHPMLMIIWGEVDRPRMEPKNMPLYTRARERLRSFTGTHLFRVREKRDRGWYESSECLNQSLSTDSRLSF